ncbi:MAG: M24 family metallopeptidase [Halodesulfurarchaeum sp.]
MDPDLSRLDEFLDESDHDGYLLDAGSELSNQRYLSGFDAEDPFLTLYTSESLVLLTSGLEYQRAKSESRADVVRRTSDFEYRALVDEHGREEARSRMLVSFLEEYDVTSVATNRRFPLYTADALRERDVGVEPDLDDVLEEVRARKTPEEIAHIQSAQRANESAMRAAESALESAQIAPDGTLTLDGEALTSERLKHTIESTLLEEGYALDDTIVASGEACAVPHDKGSGPIGAGETIIIDIFPRSKSSGYHADMTRTFVKGEPDEATREFFELTVEAKEAALDAIEPGVTGEGVHDVVCDVYEEAGYPTLRADESTDTGFIHSTGHGVGLDVHELPRVSREGEELEEGHVITIEPGLYDPEVGGVRLEDLIVVTKDGYENLTEYHQSFVI